MRNRPFPDDPQWLNLSRKLPPDAVVERLLRFGFRAADIAKAFDASRPTVTVIRRKLGIAPLVNDRHTNGCRMPYRVRMFQGYLSREDGRFVVRYC